MPTHTGRAWLGDTTSRTGEQEAAGTLAGTMAQGPPGREASRATSRRGVWDDVQDTGRVCFQKSPWPGRGGTAEKPVVVTRGSGDRDPALRETEVWPGGDAAAVPTFTIHLPHRQPPARPTLTPGASCPRAGGPLASSSRHQASAATLGAPLAGTASDVSSSVVTRAGPPASQTLHVAF